MTRAITTLDVLSALGEGHQLDREDVASLVKSANADGHEGGEHLPYYKAALGLLAQHAGWTVAVLDRESRRWPPSHPRRNAIELDLAKLRHLFRLHMRIVGVGPNHSDPAVVARVEALIAEAEGEGGGQ